MAIFSAIILASLALIFWLSQNFLRRQNLRLAGLWQWEGTIDRGPYATMGVLLMVVKFNFDRLAAALFFHIRWDPWKYVLPSAGATITSVSYSQIPFYMTLLILALPFIWTGVVLTLKRLRSAQLPSWLVIFFFMPFLNLLFFLILSCIPSRSAEYNLQSATGSRKIDKWIPESDIGSAALALVFTVFSAAAAIALGTSIFRQYGWSLFVGIPFYQGLVSALLYGYHRPRSYMGCLGVSCLCVLLSGLVLLAIAVEGIFCLAMALPLAFPLAAMGATIGYFIQRRPWSAGGTGPAIGALMIALPMLMGAEYAIYPQPPLWAVRTSMDIAAPPEKVWRNVVAFSELPAPKEWLFRIGVAHPLHAKIDGKGPGAIRHCVFSTGEFVEPIQIWDAPRLLKFSVTAQPPTMQEWSPFPGIQPPHLNNYLVSRGGQFLLTPLPNGRTHLEGTTWYQHYMWPASYWKIWSDFIIHRIHLRVLRHIASESIPGSGN